jgi:hypothetical protein
MSIGRSQIRAITTDRADSGQRGEPVFAESRILAGVCRINYKTGFLPRRQDLTSERQGG